MFDRIDKGMYWDRAWSIVEGCSPVSAGCRHCWSAQQTHMRSHQKNPKIKARYEGLNKDKTTFNGNIRPMHNNINLPRWTRKPTVWAIWNDLFHKDVPLLFIEAIWDTMMDADHHIYVILTKRPERMLEVAKYFCWIEVPHIWLGVSVESQDEDHRIRELLKVPAAVIVVSHEPALGSLILPPEFLERGKRAWTITGGETGPGARPMNPEWARNIQRQCAEAGVPYFHKQNGMWTCEKPDTFCRISGKRYSHETVGLLPDGSEYNSTHPDDWGQTTMLYRVTKKQAGRLLDGKEYSQVPEEGRLNANL